MVDISLFGIILKVFYDCSQFKLLELLVIMQVGYR